MTRLANWASRHQIAVFWITGRPDTQQALTVANLTTVGYNAASDTTHISLKPTSNPPAGPVTARPAEEIIACARRELPEEAGLRP